MALLPYLLPYSVRSLLFCFSCFFFLLYVLTLLSPSLFGFWLQFWDSSRDSEIASAAGFWFCVRVWGYVLDVAKVEIFQVSERVYNLFVLSFYYFSFAVLVWFFSGALLVRVLCPWFCLRFTAYSSPGRFRDGCALLGFALQGLRYHGSWNRVPDMLWMSDTLR